MVKLKFDAELGRLAANTIRFLAADGVQKANSGHPGMPMGAADMALVLWTHFLKFNPTRPDWPNRDRFVLSAGHGSMLLYSLLYLSGFDVTLEDLQSFRQWGSRTPGHPEVGCLPGVETTTGPLGQGFANGVGMALAAKMTAAQFNTAEYSVLGTHRVFAIVSDGDLMEGVSHEAASLAGHLKLGNLIYLYDDNHITIEGDTALTYSDDVAKRFEAYGWHTLRVDGHDQQAVADAIEAGIAERKRPTLILARTHIGYGSPHKQDTAGVHGAPLGEDELRETKRNLGWPEDKMFYVPDEVRTFFRQVVEELQKEYRQWEEQFRAWQAAHPDLAERYRREMLREVPENLEELLLQVHQDAPKATRALSGEVMQVIARKVENFVGGSADLAPSNNTYLKEFDTVAPGSFRGRNFHFGIREHGMGSILNGIALYGGFIPFGGTFLVFADYMRPAIRLAALMEQQVIYVLTHDSIFLGEDGPTHQPVEQMASLRAIPNLTVIRPADGLEVALAWAYALRRKEGPTALILTRQKVAPLSRPEGFDPGLVLKGGYVIAPENHPGRLELVLVASGSEVALALESQQKLQDIGWSVRVVSMPSLEVFRAQPEDYRRQVLGGTEVPLVVLEAGVSQGWFEALQRPFRMIGLERFGASAPYPVLAEKFGFTPDAVVSKITRWFSR